MTAEQRKIVRIALENAIRWEESSLDSYKGIGEDDPHWGEHIKYIKKLKRKFELLLKELKKGKVR